MRRRSLLRNGLCAVYARILAAANNGCGQRLTRLRLFRQQLETDGLGIDQSSCVGTDAMRDGDYQEKCVAGAVRMLEEAGSPRTTGAFLQITCAIVSSVSAHQRGRAGGLRPAVIGPLGPDPVATRSTMLRQICLPRLNKTCPNPSMWRESLGICVTWPDDRPGCHGVNERATGTEGIGRRGTSGDCESAAGPARRCPANRACAR